MRLAIKPKQDRSKWHLWWVWWPTRVGSDLIWLEYIERRLCGADMCFDYWEYRL